MPSTPIRRDWVAPCRAAIEKGALDFACASGLPPEDPLLVAAIGLRETWLGRVKDYTPYLSPDGTGDGGHGRGYFQIDDRGPFKHLIRPAPWPLDVQAAAACEVLADARHVLAPFAGSPKFLLAVVCAYNVGTIDVVKIMAVDGNPNRDTTGGEYGDDVLRVYAGIQDPINPGWLDVGAALK